MKNHISDYDRFPSTHHKINEFVVGMMDGQSVFWKVVILQCRMRNIHIYNMLQKILSSIKVR